MAVFPLKILTPDGVAFDGSVSAVSCRTISGQIQLLAKHIDYCTALGMGEAHITLEDGTIRRAAVCWPPPLNGPMPSTKSVLNAARPAPRRFWPRKTQTPANWNWPKPA